MTRIYHCSAALVSAPHSPPAGADEAAAQSSVPAAAQSPPAAGAGVLAAPAKAVLAAPET